MWDNSTRAELKDVLRNCRATLDDEEAPLVEPFIYSAHEGLVSVGGVYIDIYNEQPDFPIEVSASSQLGQFSSRCLLLN